MLLGRFARGDETFYGRLKADGTVVRLDGGLDSEWANGRVYGPGEVRALAPCTPSKIVCVGLNHREHARELNHPLPEEPVLFLKPPSAVIGPGEEILLPPQSARVDYEAELALVIRRRAVNLDPERAAEYIFGYTAANDVTARDLQQKDGQWTRAKSFDTFCPLGPYIVAGPPPEQIKVALYLNGEQRQSACITDLIFGPAALVSFVSRVMTLEPGDVILTGTPAGVGPLRVGDRVEVEVGDVGRLVNVVATRRP